MFEKVNITEKHLKRLENLIEMVEDEWGKI